MTDDFLTNGWIQLVIAVGCILGLVGFTVAVRTGALRWPGLETS